MTGEKNVDYSLYLVTGRELLPPGKGYLESLEEAIQGGVTIVQVREKNTETEEFLSIARATKTICAKYSVPLIINDRIDIALAVQADGVHVGQTDMPASIARSLLPPNAILGMSVNNVEQAKKAVEDGVDYIGVGAVWDTKTKKLVSDVIGVRGVGDILRVLDGTGIKAVAIGGIKFSNLLRTLHGSVSTTAHTLDGVAVVSEIVSAQNPKEVAQKLRGVVTEFQRGQATLKLAVGSAKRTKDELVDGVVELVKEVRKLHPLVHQITNYVVATQSANITLAAGGSPIMSAAPEEMTDLSAICNSFLINIGTLTAQTVESMLLLGQYANIYKKPVVLDPVGVGATAFRRGVVKNLLNTFQASIIKGNAGEMAALVGSAEVASKGVDSSGPGFQDPISIAKNLALRERSVIIITGSIDYISDGHITVSLHNGVEVLGKITGSGCIAGSVVATYAAVAASKAQQDLEEGKIVKGDMILAAIAGILVLTIAAEIAIEKGSVNGPGTLLPALIDEMWAFDPEEVRKRAKVIVY